MSIAGRPEVARELRTGVSTRSLRLPRLTCTRWTTPGRPQGDQDAATPPDPEAHPLTYMSFETHTDTRGSITGGSTCLLRNRSRRRSHGFES